MADASPFKHERADDSLGFLLFKLTVRWQHTLAEIFERFGITQTQYAIMASLRWHETQGVVVTQTALATHARLETMTLSKAIRKLEADGLVHREPSACDSRAMEVQLSTKGRRLVQQAVVAVERADDAFFGVLSERKQAGLRMVMRELIEAPSR
jgi:MarR family transcriptional regulator for hemolysin